MDFDTSPNYLALMLTKRDQLHSHHLGNFLSRHYFFQVKVLQSEKRGGLGIAARDSGCGLNRSYFVPSNSSDLNLRLHADGITPLEFSCYFFKYVLRSLWLELKKYC